MMILTPMHCFVASLLFTPSSILTSALPLPCRPICQSNRRLPFCQSKFQRCDQRIVPHASVSQPSPILAGDLVVHRISSETADMQWELAAVTHVHDSNVELAPVHCRSEDEQGRYEVFINWKVFESQLRNVTLANEEIVALDVDYETRVIEDRIINPHGEESEDCWYVNRTLLKPWSINLNVEKNSS